MRRPLCSLCGSTIQEGEAGRRKLEDLQRERDVLLKMRSNVRRAAAQALASGAGRLLPCARLRSLQPPSGTPSFSAAQTRPHALLPMPCPPSAAGRERHNQAVRPGARRREHTQEPGKRNQRVRRQGVRARAQDLGQPGGWGAASCARQRFEGARHVAVATH